MCTLPLMSKWERSHVKNLECRSVRKRGRILEIKRVQTCKEKGGESCLDGCCSFSHHMLPSMTKGKIVANMCLINCH